MPSDTTWFKNAKWGVFFHYLAAPASSSGGAEISAENWNTKVDSFDAKSAAQQLADAGVGYAFITLGQDSGHYCSPNPTYDSFVGIQPSRCSRRDLVADFSDALAVHGIRLCVYVPSGAPGHDPAAAKNLEWENGYAPDGTRAPKRLASFQRKWEAVLRDWSERWGKKIHGWWIDGCYFADAMYRFDDEPNFRSFAAALKSGNPDSIVSFNGGVANPIISMTEYEDFTAGEEATEFPVATWGAGSIDPLAAKIGGAQLHILDFLGHWWGQGTPRFPDMLVAGYTQYINQCGGVVTWDVPISFDGKIQEAFIRQLKVIWDATR